jgi:hypothetical protein
VGKNDEAHIEEEEEELIHSRSRQSRHYVAHRPVEVKIFNLLKFF